MGSETEPQALHYSLIHNIFLSECDTMTDSPYSLSPNDIKVFTEEDWRGIDLGNFQGDRPAVRYPTSVISAHNNQRDHISQTQSMPLYSNFIPVSRGLDWSFQARNDMYAASLERHYTTDSPGMASLEIQSAPDTSSSPAFNFWTPETHGLIDPSSDFCQDDFIRADYRSSPSSTR